MIKYKKFDALIDACRDLFCLLHDKTLGFAIDEEKLIEMYRIEYVGPFLKEFNKNVINTSDDVILHRYLNEVYYNGVVRRYIDFKNLAKEYEHFRKYEDRRDLLRDDYFTKILGLRDVLSLTASEIRAKGLEFKMAELKPIHQISLDDYNISGRYMKLYDHPKDLEEQQKKELNQPEQASEGRKNNINQPEEILSPQSSIPEGDFEYHKDPSKQNFENKCLLEFFKEDKRVLAEEVVLPYLKENYKNAKGTELAIFWLGIVKAGYAEKLQHGDKANLFRELKSFLNGKHGAPEWFSKQLKYQDHLENKEVRKVERKIKEIVQEFEKVKK